jgi:hypothetical protein
MTALAVGEVSKGLLYRGAKEQRPVFTDGKHRKLVFVDYWPDGNQIRCLKKVARESIHLILHVNQVPVSQLRRLKVWELLPPRKQISLQIASDKV